MDYNERNYKEIYNILDNNNGSIDSKHIDDIFYAFQIASGQGYFKARIKAILDYFANHSFVIIKYPDKDIELKNLHELENCFQTYDREFKISNL